MMKILIADDEYLARARLRGLIDELGIGEVIAEACNGEETLAMVRLFEPDVVLLDIRMPELDGMEVIQQLALIDSAPAVIFTTAYSDHALAAFEHQAIDYLLKPIRKERLERALKRTEVLKPAKSTLISSVQTPRARTHISYFKRGELCLIPVDQIDYFDAYEKYVRMHCKEGEVLISEALKNLEAEFSGQFFRIHRHTLVAIAQIIALKRKGMTRSSYILLKDIEKPLKVSQRFLPTLKQFLKDMHVSYQ